MSRLVITSIDYFMLDFILKLLRALAGVGRSANTQASHLQTGIVGEERAADYIRREGYQVLASRWTARLIRGDLDLIAMKDSLLCFIEVKTRTAHDDSPAERTVNAEKRKTLRKMARSYLRKYYSGQRPAVRFDILSVYMIPGKPTEFMHIKNAFTWNEHDKYLND